MEKVTSPKISVIIPVYNMAQYLDETIQSWTSQTLKEIELIYIDDCSIDNAINQLIEYSDMADDIATDIVCLLVDVLM